MERNNLQDNRWSVLKILFKRLDPSSSGEFDHLDWFCSLPYCYICIVFCIAYCVLSNKEINKIDYIFYQICSNAHKNIAKKSYFVGWGVSAQNSLQYKWHLRYTRIEIYCCKMHENCQSVFVPLVIFSTKKIVFPNRESNMFNHICNSKPLLLTFSGTIFITSG